MKTHNLATLLLCGILAISLAQAQAVPDRFTEDEAKAIETFLDEGFTETYAAMVIGIIDRDGSRIFTKGKLDNGTDQLATEETLFEIGSITKVFTSLLALELDREGLLSLDDPAEKYLPKGMKVTRYQNQQITIRNLAVQDSGLPFHPPNPPSEDWREGVENYTMQLLREHVASFPLTIAPGTRFQYSNVGMSVLGHALAGAAEKDWQTLVVERICNPLGLNNTRWQLTPDQEARFAMGHNENGEPNGHLKLEVMAAAGALRSTVSDMLSFVGANLGFTTSRLSPLFTEMQQIQHEGDRVFGRTAIPWVDMNVYNPPGSHLMGHSGGTTGGTAFIGFDILRKRGVVVLSNQKKQSTGPIGWTILQSLPLTKDNTTIPVQEIAGIGAALAMDQISGQLKITRVLPNTPAEQSGLVDGLLIAKINGVPTRGMEINQCVELIRGPVGSGVLLDLLDNSGSSLEQVEVIRRKFLTGN